MEAPLEDQEEDVCLSMLFEAIRTSDGAAANHWGRLCAKHGVLDRRLQSSMLGQATAGADGGTRLAALPHWYAVLQGDEELLEELLPHMAADDVNVMPGGCCHRHTSGGCPTCSPSALHLAAGRRSVSIVRTLLRLGASTALPMCFTVQEQQRPGLESTQVILSGFSALRLARYLGEACIAALLEEHDASSIDTSAHPDSECPICFEALDTAALTTPCAHRFHARCLPPTVTKCPLCRTPLERMTRVAQQRSPNQRQLPYAFIELATLTTHAGSRPEPGGASLPPGSAVEGLGGMQGAGGAAAAVRTPSCAGPIEPPYLSSPVWRQGEQRVYTEIERRRL